MVAAHPLPLLPLDPVLAALARAPVGEPLPPDLEAEIEEREEAVAAGRVKLVPHVEVQGKVRAQRERQGG